MTAPDEVTFTFDQNRQPRAAGDRRRAARSAQALVGGHRRQGQQARHRQGHAGAAARLRPLQGRRRSVPGRSITYERVPDFWGKDLTVNVGSNNFDQIAYEYYRDRDVEFAASRRRVRLLGGERGQALGDGLRSSPPSAEGKVKKEAVKLEQASGVMVGFVPNLRRACSRTSGCAAPSTTPSISRR